ncbi:hypothetical protein [Actinomadura sp. NPDC048394]|uniref:hypothetical protein n=1 Tax=Actinomadura sp. NPDC048394 TaxID=3158223 RepID=UPI003410B5FE
MDAAVRRDTAVRHRGGPDRAADTVAHQVRIDAADVLTIGWLEAPPAGARLVLRHTGSGGASGAPSRTEHTVPLNGRPSCSVALGALGLARGTWTVLLDTLGLAPSGTAGSGADDPARPLLTDDPGFSLDGLRAYADVRRERAIRVVRAPGGQVALDVREVAPHAEVTAVRPAGGEIQISGRLAYTGPRPGRARLAAVARKGGGATARDLRIDGTEFEACLPIDALAAGPPALWDLWLEAAGVRARLATLLDDAPGKRNKLSFPRQIASGAGGTMSVRPYYTVEDALSVACHLVDERDAA